MGLYLIKGTFHVKGYSPDGDSLRFRAEDEVNWELLGPGPLAITSKKDVQLRFQGIDTLETHFSAPGGEVHQPPDLANQATDFLLASLNITGVIWDNAHRHVVQANDGTPGYILARHKAKGGRPVAFVFAGPTAEADRSKVFLTVERMKTSLNYRLLTAGHAYPMYYTGLLFDLRDALTAAVTKARNKGKGLYPRDKSAVGVVLDTISAITEDHPIFPKLFRRLAEYIAGDATPDMSGFRAWLEARDGQVSVLVIPRQQFTHLDNLVEVTDQQVRLTELPENLVCSE